MTRLPAAAVRILRPLLDAGYDAYLVGGSVRDLLLDRSGGDLDFTTNARPEQIQRVFRRSHYPNRFGTVLVSIGGAQHEVTTYRGEGRYSDHRHPDEILFVDRLEEDLQRRDFTMNAMAMGIDGTTVDPFGGREDLRRHVIRAVGNPYERLAEDPLRMMRAARLATQLAFTIDRETWEAIAANAGLLAMVSRERVRDELLKILGSEHPVTGIDFLDHLHLLEDALPELAAARRVNRPVEERDDTYQHALQTMRFAPPDALLRLAALLHVLGEAVGDKVGPQPGSAVPSPASLQQSPRGEIAASWERGRLARSRAQAVRTQLGNPQQHGRDPSSPALLPLREKGVPVGAQFIAPARPSDALQAEVARLRLSNADAARVGGLIAALPDVPPDLPAHERSARRLLSRYETLLPALLDLVEAHRRAESTPNAARGLEQLDSLRRMIALATTAQQPRSISDLAVTGNDLMRELRIPPGPEVGRLLRALLERVLDDPALNERGTLLELARRL